MAQGLGMKKSEGDMYTHIDISVRINHHVDTYPRYNSHPHTHPFHTYHRHRFSMYEEKNLISYH